MTEIYAPNKDYTGIVAGVVFNEGMGETNDKRLINWFQEKGYKIIEEKKEKTVDEMTVDELKVYAVANEIDLGEATKKADILEVIKGSK